MKKNNLFSFCVLAVLSTSLSAQIVVENKANTIKAAINSSGVITSLSLNNIESHAAPVQFRSDSLSGPSLVLNGKKLALKHDTDFRFDGKTDNLQYSLSYIVDSNKLGLEVACKNTTQATIDSMQLSLRLGLSTEMKSYPQWREEFFPTLMRCEKTHFWGYLMTPNGRVLTVSSPTPIASYRLHYNNSRIFGHGHLIRTVSLDLLNPGPLPERHPAKVSSIKGGETKKWIIFLEEVTGLESVKSTVLANTQAPTIDADLYTVRSLERSYISIKSKSKPVVTVKTPDNKQQRITIKQDGEESYYFNLEPIAKGIYTVYVNDRKNKKVSEAKISCIANDYSDYIKSARRTTIKYPQQASSNNESWYGFFSGYIAKEKFPDKEWDQQLDEKFDELYPLLYDTITNIPTYYMRRIQNHALMAALFAQKYKASGDIGQLRKAADLADYILAMQSPDGAYRNGNVHYTSVIYIAKAIMEVMEQEKPLMAQSEEWSLNYKRHYHSVKKAIDDLATNLDNIQTEGEMTFEDGMISCSYTQISQFALLQPEGSADRKRYIEAAEKLLQLHRCLSQLIIPDSRMNGGSMRYWEAQYDILASPNMMNSPHGWTAWRIYGLKNLYELTGKYEYLQQMMNAIGTCIQLLDPDTDNLNWAFIVDPYIDADVFVENTANPGNGIYRKQVIGEQYMPMISDWYRPKSHTRVTGYWGYDGGNCDNDVHEIFKCLNETLLTNAYVVEKEDGSFIGFNCAVQKVPEGINVIPNESIVTDLHYNVLQPIKISFSKKTKAVSEKSFGWITSL